MTLNQQERDALTAQVKAETAGPRGARTVSNLERVAQPRQAEPDPFAQFTSPDGAVVMGND